MGGVDLYYGKVDLQFTMSVSIDKLVDPRLREDEKLFHLSS